MNKRLEIKKLIEENEARKEEIVALNKKVEKLEKAIKSSKKANKTKELING